MLCFAELLMVYMVRVKALSINLLVKTGRKLGGTMAIHDKYLLRIRVKPSYFYEKRRKVLKKLRYQLNKTPYEERQTFLSSEKR